jgi:hypothetical protein
MFESAPNFSLTGKAQLKEDGGRILLGDNTGSCAVKLQSIRFRCAGVLI